MKIRALFFAAVRDAIGVRELELELSGTAVRDAADLLRARYPGAVPVLERAQFAVNEEYAKPETFLNDGDVLAVIPPVSGG